MLRGTKTGMVVVWTAIILVCIFLILGEVIHFFLHVLHWLIVCILALAIVEFLVGWRHRKDDD